MLETYTFRKYRKIDVGAIFLLSAIWALINSLIALQDSQLTFMLSLFITTIFVAFTSLLIRKFGSVILFYFIGSILTLKNDNLGLGHYGLPILLIVGAIFELFFLLLRIKIKNIPLDVVFGASIANFSIPFVMLLFIETTDKLMPYIWNFAWMALIIGVMGSIITFLIWYNIKGLKPIIKFEYSL